MIRRELTMPDGAKLWLLIPQVEHAHISGILAQNWNEEFSAEVVAAITHHDDGWAQWESAPKLDPQFGRPCSFLEMHSADSLAIWRGSIASARRFGPLAGWIVAGHFVGLLGDSEHAREARAARWLTEMADRRAVWLDEWQRAERSHTLPVAERAQRMLLTADLFSLWLCCDCPVLHGGPSTLGKSDIKPRADAVLGRYRFALADCAVSWRPSGDGTILMAWTVAVAPWPCAGSELSLAAKAIAVPVRRYADWQELVAGCWPVELRWKLVSAAPAAGSAA